MKHNYEDIIHLPYNGSKRSKRISMAERGAQFSPFAALTGYDAKILEAARLTDGEKELGIDAKLALDKKLQLLFQLHEKRPMVSITYFVSDEKKSGGSYETISGAVKSVDPYEEVIQLEDGRTVEFCNIFDISGDILSLSESRFFSE